MGWECAVWAGEARCGVRGRTRRAVKWAAACGWPIRVVSSKARTRKSAWRSVSRGACRFQPGTVGGETRLPAMSAIFVRALAPSFRLFSVAVADHAPAHFRALSGHFWVLALAWIPDTIDSDKWTLGGNCGALPAHTANQRWESRQFTRTALCFSTSNLGISVRISTILRRVGPARGSVR